MKIYLAGPISGKSFEEVVGRYNVKKDYLTDFGFQVFSPMTAKGGLKGADAFHPTGYAGPVANDHSIFARDRWMVTQADVVLADLSNSGDRVSIGTVMEIAWASYLNKQVIVVMGPGNPHRHAFVLEAATIVLETWEDARDYLKDLIEGSL